TKRRRFSSKGKTYDAPIPDSTTPIKSEFGAPVSSNATLTFYADAVPIPNASGRPSMPSEFAIVAGSATHSSVVVSWKGGSNGGSRQTFQVEYTIVEPNKEVFHASVEDTEQENENATLTQLSSNTEYTVKMTSSNIHGTSGYTDEINFRTMQDTTRSEQDVYSHYEIADRVNMDRMISAENHGTAGTGNGNGFNSSTNEQQDMYYLHPQHQQRYETPIDRQVIYSHYATAETTNMDKRSSSAKCIIL
ncbi:hypothetical protein MAR_002708, partial [Mya arenaria]